MTALRTPHRPHRVRRTITAAAVAAVLGLTGCDVLAAFREPRELTILAEEGGIQLEELAGSYTERTRDRALVATMTRSGLQKLLRAELGSSAAPFDVVTLDGDRLMEFADGLLPLGDRLTDEVLADLVPGAVEGAMADGRYMGMPVSVDSRVLFYRTDLFGDPAEQAAFEEEYGYPLAPPADWGQYRDVAEFFTRDTDGDGVTDLFGTDL